jgi:uncharacterized membrane protein (DUF485 family)
MEPGVLERIQQDPVYNRLRRKAAAIRWAMTALAIFAYGSYSWLTGYAGEWFSRPLVASGSVTIGLAWIAGSILLLVATQVVYEWFCRKELDPLRTVLTNKYMTGEADESG